MPAPHYIVALLSKWIKTVSVGRLAARVFLRCVSFLLIFAILLPVFSSTVAAQTQEPVTTSTVNNFVKPNVESNVAQNQHTFVQSLFIEMLLAIECQLTGIDFADPTKSCLGINTGTGQLGYVPEESYQNGHPPFGGVLGMVTGGIGAMYTPVFGSGEYFHYLADNFGLVKKTIAAPTGFQGLSPVIELWKVSRDIAYFLLIIAFMFIGIGVMLRIHIDPRTVMTVQNQIPRVIICIILITFSYAFAGLMIDVMWAVTYMGINKLSEKSVPAAGCTTDNNVGSDATSHLLSTPFSFGNIILANCGNHNNGIFDLGRKVGVSLSSLEWDIILQLVGGDRDRGCSGFFDWGCIVEGAIGTTFKFFASIMWQIIITIVVLIQLFRIWFELLKCYAKVLIYTVLGPIWIVFGLLPKKPLGFEKWLRIYFSELAVFPATVLMLIAARIFSDLFNGNPSDKFIPPLVGNPHLPDFGAILEFAFLLITPTVQGILREKLSVPPSKPVSAAISGGFSMGRAAAGAVAKKTWASWNRRNQMTGTGEAWMSRGIDTLKFKGLQRLAEKFGRKPGGVLQRAAERAEGRKEGRGPMTRKEYARAHSIGEPDKKSDKESQQGASAQQPQPASGATAQTQVMGSGAAPSRGARPGPAQPQPNAQSTTPVQNTGIQPPAAPSSATPSDFGGDESPTDNTG